MRCKKCRKEITGIGKPALPPAIPALVAWAGVTWAMWFLTLGENPLPSWTPAPGWAVGLGALAAATVMGWIALARRKCPECGSRQMFEAMEEESLLASERQAAVEQARSGGGLGAETDRERLRMEVEAELRVSLAKETAESRAASAKEMAELRAAAAKEASELRGRLEQELRAEIGQQMRAGQAESERGLRQQLTNQLRPEIERELRPHIEQKLRPDIERELRPQIEQKLRPDIERELRPQIEQRLRPDIERELRPQIEQKLRPEIEKELRASLPKPVQAVIEEPKASASSAERTPQAIPSSPRVVGKPALIPATTPSPLATLPGLGRPSPTRPTPPPATKPANADAPKAGEPAEPAAPASKGQGTIPRFPMPGMPRPARAKSASPETPSPVSVKPPVSEPSKTPSLVSVKPSVPEPSKTPSPVSPSAAAPESAKTPVLVSVNRNALAKTVPASSAKPAALSLTPSPVAMPGTTTDPRERAERRARVIVSDLSLYHKDLLAKAAQASDAKKELGTLWRDAVLAYDRTVPLEVRNNTHYLEDELDRYLAQLRKTQSAPAGQANG